MVRADARQKLEIRREQSQFVRNEVNNNREIEAHISFITRSTIRLRDDYSELLKTVDELTSEVSNLVYRHMFHRKVFIEVTAFWHIVWEMGSNVWEERVLSLHSVSMWPNPEGG